MKKLLLFFIFVCCPYAEQHACSRIINSVRSAYNYLMPPAYQHTILKGITCIAATTSIKFFHILIPKSIDVPLPVITSLMAQAAMALPNITAQEALRRYNPAKTLTLQNISRAIGIGVCSAMIMCVEGHALLLVLPPEGWISNLSFLCVNIATVPMLTAWTSSIASSTLQRLYSLCCGRRQITPGPGDSFIIDVLHPLEQND